MKNKKIIIGFSLWILALFIIPISANLYFGGISVAALLAILFVPLICGVIISLRKGSLSIEEKENRELLIGILLIWVIIIFYLIIAGFFISLLFSGDTTLSIPFSELTLGQILSFLGKIALAILILIIAVCSPFIAATRER